MKNSKLLREFSALRQDFDGELSRTAQGKLGRMRREFSAGGVVYRKLKVKPIRQAQGKREKLKVVWLIGKHSGYHKWVLPKGLIEKGEHGWETALREVEEEAGVKARLVSEKPVHRVQYVYWADFREVKSQKSKVQNKEIDYQQSDDVKARRRVTKYQESGGGKTKVFKVVSFYLMEYESGDVAKHGWEMEEAAWFSYDEALKQLAFEGEQEALEKARDTILELRAKS